MNLWLLRWGRRNFEENIKSVLLRPRRRLLLFANIILSYWLIVLSHVPMPWSNDQSHEPKSAIESVCLHVRIYNTLRFAICKCELSSALESGTRMGRHLELAGRSVAIWQVKMWPGQLVSSGVLVLVPVHLRNSPASHATACATYVRVNYCWPCN